jgi:hypothetical protein
MKSGRDHLLTDENGVKVEERGESHRFFHLKSIGTAATSTTDGQTAEKQKKVDFDEQIRPVVWRPS